MWSSIAVVAFIFLMAQANSFHLNTLPQTSRIRLSALQMSANVDPNEGYGPFGSLLRQGPVPFFIRLTNPSTYEAAVNKYMALEKCDRMTAQGNMDFYFQDPNGWAANKLKSRKTGNLIN